jgi:putative membrane protein
VDAAPPGREDSRTRRNSSSPLIVADDATAAHRITDHRLPITSERTGILASVAKRWPGWVYDEGDEPDPRFSFANERTFLAWIRTSLGLLATGVALQALPVDIEATPRKWLAVLFIVLALATGGVGWSRWARSERAMRRGERLPGSAMTAVLVGGVAVAGLILLFAIGLR